MKKILIFNGSITGTSKGILDQVLAIKTKKSEVKITDINLTKEFGHEILSAENVATSWYDGVKKWVKLIDEHDEIIFTTGTINYFISPPLKSLIDKIILSGVTFKYTKKGPKPIYDNWANKKVKVLQTSGSPLSAEKNIHAAIKEIVTTALRFIGLLQIEWFLLDGLDAPALYGKSIEEKFMAKKSIFGL